MKADSSRKAKEWQRARTPEQQQKRRDAILQAAYCLFEGMDFADISLNKIAKQAELSKPSVYLYFQTREEIFLEIFQKAFRNWIDRLVKAIEQLSVESDSNDIAAVWVNVSWKDEKMCSLVPILNSIIERNISDDSLANTLWIKIHESEKLNKALQGFIPNISKWDTYELLIYMMYLFSQFITSENNKQLHRVVKMDNVLAGQINIKDMMIRGLSRLIDSYKTKQDKG